MNDSRCAGTPCVRCALSFGDGYLDIEPGRPIENPLPPEMAIHATVAWQVFAPPGAAVQLSSEAARPALGLPTDYAARKRLQIWTFLTQYFPDAFLAVVEVAVQGNEQHNTGEPLHWARHKSTDQMNTAARHMFDHSTVGPKDTDNCYHLAKAIWRLSAELQLLIEADGKI